ncbi:MAG: DNA starvation/stationary phase protection protein [Bdellovibrionota bacterium]|nr:DNA starvation/stationary phase protection protein [Pseudobdellovibrionaceae bacterium]|tara:strand:- start:11194 stop:11721 length:528 start_codon:yes stop_codon:yes gene_type:complete
MRTSTKENIETSFIKKTKASPKLAVDKSTATTVDYLNSLLANEFSLFTKTLNYHWNITGPRFHSMHEFLDEQYHSLLEVVDEVAERIRQLDAFPNGTLKNFDKKSVLDNLNDSSPQTSTMISDLVNDHETIDEQIKLILKSLEKNGDDPATEDLLGGLSKKHEEMKWMLKSHLDS